MPWPNIVFFSNISTFESWSLVSSIDTRHAKSREPGNLIPGHFEVKSGHFLEIKALMN